jgi:D-alanyl-D-alanine endopeptidase (penicillin-binding protein 7)
LILRIFWEFSKLKRYLCFAMELAMAVGVLASGFRAWLRPLAVGLLVGLAPLTQAVAGHHHHKRVAVSHTHTHTVAKAARTGHVAKARSGRAAKRAGRRAGRARQRVAYQMKAALRAAVHVESMGQQAGLHAVHDGLALKSGVALVIDPDTQEVLLDKNGTAVLPIASLTKLMTGLVVSEARLPLDEPITITQEDVDTERGSRSRLAVGTELTRGELMHLALMSSENRAAHALGRTFPGGMANFVHLMNTRAMALGMADTRYVEPTGLSSSNRSSAHDLAALVAAASHDSLLRQLSTSPGFEVAVGNRLVQFRNTNRLVRDPYWQIDLQKTGYISEAGRCLVMQARVAGRKLIMVFLDSEGKQSRLADAERVRSWIELRRGPSAVVSSAYSKG